jgi:phosphopentomutase
VRTAGPVIPERRAVLLVLDGLGMGAMADCPIEDRGSHTLRHVEQKAGPLQLHNLHGLGLGRLEGPNGPEPDVPVRGAYGLAELGYPGADTYLGHQELMGLTPAVQLQPLSELRAGVVSALEAAGHTTSDLFTDASPLVVDGCVVVADNIEARPGLNVNVTGSLDDCSFATLTEIGQVVRTAVSVPRVIVVAGRGFGIEDIRAHVKERAPGQIGVDSPKLGVYDEHYQVRHLGVEVDASRQLPSLVLASGGQVVLLGKAADVIQCDSAIRQVLVSTPEILQAAITSLNGMRSGLLVVNVQETDLAGHTQDPKRFARVLEAVDRFLPQLLGRLGPADVLVVTADHGNDPCIGHSQHTREAVPVLVAGPQVRPVPLGRLGSLADVGATLADWLEVDAPPDGTSFARGVWGRSA